MPDRRYWWNTFRVVNDIHTLHTVFSAHFPAIHALHARSDVAVTIAAPYTAVWHCVRSPARMFTLIVLLPVMNVDVGSFVDVKTCTEYRLYAAAYVAWYVSML